MATDAKNGPPVSEITRADGQVMYREINWEKYHDMGFKPDFHGYHATFEPPFSKKVAGSSIIAVVAGGTGLCLFATWVSQKKAGIW
jgi:hypothetical protein